MIIQQWKKIKIQSLVINDTPHSLHFSGTVSACIVERPVVIKSLVVRERKMTYSNFYHIILRLVI